MEVEVRGGGSGFCVDRHLLADVGDGDLWRIRTLFEEGSVVKSTGD